MSYDLGVDVSKWQTPEKVDWRRLRDDGNVRYMIGASPMPAGGARWQWDEETLGWVAV